MSIVFVNRIMFANFVKTSRYNTKWIGYIIMSVSLFKQRMYNIMLNL